jgi:FkbM family methyltransferase
MRGGGPEAPTTVRVKPLGGREVVLRRGTLDVYAFSDAYVTFEHLPPREALERPMKQILELGTNVGYGLSEMAHRYSAARLVGVEADPENAAMARRNVAAWADRVEVVPAAVWDSDTELTIEPGGDSHGNVVRERRPGDGPELPTIPAYSVETLLAERFPDGPIDFVLLSAERSERRVLQNANAWLQRVDAIKVEAYLDGDYGPQDTVADLQAAGFTARHEPNPWGGFVVGFRD